MKRNFFLIILLLIVLTGWVGQLSTPTVGTAKPNTEQVKKQDTKNDSPWSVLGFY